jgi:glycerate-2-kinase
MKRYSMEEKYTPYTGEYEGITGVEDSGGEWVDADVAETMYEALVLASKELSSKDHEELLNKINYAIELAEGRV